MIAELIFVIVIVALALPGLVVRAFELSGDARPRQRIAIPRAIQS